jgi:opacity protein-like surface antigen
MKLLTIAAVSALLMLGTAAQAQQAKSPLYGELGYTVLTVKESSSGFSASPTALRGIIGYDLHPFVAVEGMLAFGVSDDSDKGVNAKLQNAYGVFVKPKFNPNENFEVFGRLGWVKTKFKFSDSTGSETQSESDFAYGVGANYHFNPRMSVGLDYMRYSKKDGVKVDGVTVSFGYRF